MIAIKRTGPFLLFLVVMLVGAHDPTDAIIRVLCYIAGFVAGYAAVSAILRGRL